MASTSDIRDILNLGSGPRPPAPKKKKRVEPLLPRMTGVSREVQALMGDSVPPIAIVEHKAYKSKPSISQKLFKARHWEERPFLHGARQDGLVLKHWKRSIPRAARPPTITTPTDVEMAEGVKELAQAGAVDMAFEDEFPSSKWNVKVPVDRYTDAQYADNFKSDDWSKEETDYLIQLCEDFDLRWILIADRYDPGEIAGPRAYGERTMEQLKSRYYSIAARLMEMRTPASNMTATEFQLWEKMRNFDAKTEKVRKDMADKLFERTKDEAEEEKILLEELHRITKNEEDFIKLRRDLYSRLESVAPIRRTERGEEQSTAMYQTSAGLSMLLQSLLAKERKLKRPQPQTGAPPTPAEPKRSQPNQYTRRETVGSPADEGATKKGSAAQPTVRTLTAAEEIKYGVAHPKERLTSGVQFRHEKINRLTMAKSQVQTSKMQAALAELGIPPRLLMPTEKVCREFERLVNSIHLLLDARKVSDKVKAEIQVLQEARRIRLGLPKEADGAGAATASRDSAAANTSHVVQVKAEEDEAGNIGDKEDEAKKSDKQNAGADADVDAEGDGDKDEAVNDSTHVDEDEDDGARAGQASAQEDEDEEEEDDANAVATIDPDEEDDDDNEDVDESGPDAADASEAADADSDSDNEDVSEAAPDADGDGNGNADSDDGADEDDGDEEAHANQEDDGDDDDDDDDDDEASQPPSSHSAAPPPAVAAVASITRGRKRSASVLSASSKTGSTRSAPARKRRK
ncbi:hypothetical protein DV737_g5509, partial [Chaetothyriales sp. CBS 132003]